MFMQYFCAKKKERPRKLHEAAATAAEATGPILNWRHCLKWAAFVVPSLLLLWLHTTRVLAWNFHLLSGSRVWRPLNFILRLCRRRTHRTRMMKPVASKWLSIFVLNIYFDFSPLFVHIFSGSGEKVLFNNVGWCIERGPRDADGRRT